MTQPLMVKLGADVGPAAKALTMFATQAAGHLGAVSAAALAAGKATDLSMTGIATSAARGIGVLVAQHYIAIAAVGAFAAAAAAGAAELERFQKIAEKAAASNLGTTFFQSFTEGAREFGLKVKDLEADLSALEKATRTRFSSDSLSGTQNQAQTKLEGAFLDMPGFSQSLDMLRNAATAEERVRAVLQGLTDLEAQGRKLEAIDLARSLGLGNLAERVELGRASFAGFTAEVDRLAQTGLRDGSLVSPELIARSEELKKRWEANSEELSKNLRPILDECSRLALEIGNGAAWSAEQFTKLVGVLGSVVKLLREAANAAPATIAAAQSDTDREARRVIEGRLRDSGLTPLQRSGLQQQLEVLNGRERMRQGQQMLADDANPVIPFDASMYGGGAPTGRTAPLPVSRAATNAPTRAASTGGGSGEDDTDKRTEAIKKMIEAMEKANAISAAELAAVGRTAVERERLVKIAEAEAKARENGGTLTDAERQKILQLATAHAELANKIKEAEGNAKALSDAFQYAGDRLVDLIFQGKSLKDFAKGLWTEIGRAGLTGQGPLAGILGMKPAAGSPAGTLGGLLGLFQPSAGSGGAAGGGGFLAWLQSLFGGGGAAAGAPLNLLSFVGHSGLVVGGGGGVPRMVPAGAFSGAPRFHSGGAIMPHERPIIAELGEEVLSRKARNTTAAALRAAGEGGRSAPVVNVINNHPGADASRAETQEDGSVSIFIEQNDARIAAGIASGRGPIAGAIGQSVGGNGSGRNMIG